jgi:thiol:disulfide interchange protein DsbG
MTGWVLVQGPGEHFIVYTPADHSVAIAGTMVDAAGANLTEAHSREHAPRIDYNQAWERLERSHFVVEGARGRDVRSTIYVFKDPNCTFCNLAHIALEPYTRAGLQVRWIPVAFLRPDSFGKSAFLLEHADSDVAVDRVNESFGRSDPTVVIPVSAPTRARIEANNRLMQELGFRGTPAVVYRDRRGQAHAIPGMFRLSQLPEITGLPQKPQTDPRLERFR